MYRTRLRSCVLPVYNSVYGKMVYIYSPINCITSSKGLDLEGCQISYRAFGLITLPHDSIMKFKGHLNISYIRFSF